MHGGQTSVRTPHIIDRNNMPDFKTDQNFAELAHSALYTSDARLLPFISGFQTISASDDGSRMVGMFGVSVGPKLFFIPVFFLKGSVKPLSIVFDYKEDKFMPLDKQWVSEILKVNSTTIGSPERDPSVGFSTILAPDTNGANSLMLKQGSVAEMVFPKLKHFVMDKKASKVGSFLPAYFEEASLVEKRAFMQMLQDVEFARLVDKKVGLDLIKKAYASNSKKIEAGVSSEDAPATEAGGVEVVTLDPRKNIKAILDKVPTEGREALLNKGYYINDNRTSTAQTYNTQYESQFLNPVASGEYTTIMEDGSIERTLVLVRPHALVDNQAIADCYIIKPGTLEWAKEAPSKVDASPVRRADDVLGKVLSKGVSSKAMLPGKSYILINPSLKNVSCRFTVKTMRSTKSGTVSYCCSTSESYDNVYLLAGLVNAEKFKKVGNEVIVPGDAIAVELPGYPFRIGRLGDLSNQMLHTGLEPVVVVADGVEYDIGGGQKLDRAGAMTKLLVDKNMAVPDAEAVLDKAASLGRYSVLVKQAQPTVINTLESSDRPESTIGQPSSVEQSPQYQSEQSMSYEDPYLATGVADSPEMLKSLPTLAAELNTNIFDTSVLASLADTHNPSELLKQYVPDFKEALDKLGRTLFLLWWKYDHFREVYSPAEVTAMESNVRLLLSKLGELTINIKRRFKDNT